MKTKDLIAYLERKYPKKLAETWDNVGLLLGDLEKEVKKVLLTVDVSQDIVEEAVAEKVDMIVSHHPMIFQGIKSICMQDVLGKKIFSLVKAGINVYTLHTNIDAQAGGLNDFLLESLGVEQSVVLAEQEEGIGIGRMFRLSTAKTVADCLKDFQEAFSLESFRYIGKDRNRLVKKICFINGAGASYWKLAKAKGVDLFISGDIRYHDAFDILESGMDAMDIGHWESEQFFVELLQKDLESLGVDCIINPGKAVFQTIQK